jgi:hypothetical protein
VDTGPGHWVYHFSNAQVETTRNTYLHGNKQNLQRFLQMRYRQANLLAEQTPASWNAGIMDL